VWRIFDSQEGVSYLTSLVTGCVLVHEEHGADAVGSGNGISEYDAMVGNGGQCPVLIIEQSLLSYPLSPPFSHASLTTFGSR
jgi:hypothetical protein